MVKQKTAGLHPHSACRPACAFRVPIGKDSEFHDMQMRFPAFHAEYWIYVLAACVIVVFGALLYTADGPIKFSSCC